MTAPAIAVANFTGELHTASHTITITADLTVDNHGKAMLVSPDGIDHRRAGVSSLTWLSSKRFATKAIPITPATTGSIRLLAF
jgi:hypothetical protein